jgi:hypothetical protein
MTAAKIGGVNFWQDSFRLLLSSKLYPLTFYLLACAILSVLLEGMLKHGTTLNVALWTALVLVLPLHVAWAATVLAVKEGVKLLIRSLIEFLIGQIRELPTELQDRFVKLALAGSALLILAGVGMIIAALLSLVSIIETHSAGPTRTLAVDGGILLLELATLLSVLSGPVLVLSLFSALSGRRPMSPIKRTTMFRNRPQLVQTYQFRVMRYAYTALEDVAHEKNVTLVHSAPAGASGAGAMGG